MTANDDDNNQVKPTATGLVHDLVRVGISSLMKTALADLPPWTQDEVVGVVLRRLSALGWQVDRLRAEAEFSFIDFALVLRSFGTSMGRTSDPKMRAALEHALVNVLDSELYHEGFGPVLWERLDRLDYGSLAYLGALSGTDYERHVGLSDWPPPHPGTTTHLHIGRLLAEGLILSDAEGRLRVTKLGIMLLDLIETPDVL